MSSLSSASSPYLSSASYSFSPSVGSASALSATVLMSPRSLDGNDDEKDMIIQNYEAVREQSKRERNNRATIHVDNFNNALKVEFMRIYSGMLSGGIGVKKVFDMSCGKGRDMHKTKRLFPKLDFYAGIDLSPTSIQIASSQEDDKVASQFAVADASDPSRKNWPVYQGQLYGSGYDLVVSNFAMHYVCSSEKSLTDTLQNAYAILRPGGRFVATVLSESEIVHRLKDKKSDSFGNRLFRIQFDATVARDLLPANNAFGTRYHFSLKDRVDMDEYLVPREHVEEIAKKIGFRVIEVKTASGIARDYMRHMYCAHWNVLGTSPGAWQSFLHGKDRRGWVRRVMDELATGSTPVRDNTITSSEDYHRSFCRQYMELNDDDFDVISLVRVVVIEKPMDVSLPTQ